MSESPSAVVDQGLLRRAIGVIVSPGATFRTVAAYPRPAGILFVACLVIGLSAGLPQLTERGRQAALDLQVQQMERFSGQSVTPEAYARMQRSARYGVYIATGSVFLILPLAATAFAALYWVLVNTIFGATSTFKQVLGVVTHSMVIGALGTLAAAPIQFLSDTPSLTGPFTFAAVAPMLPPGSFVAGFLAGINFFTLWQLVVTSIGLAVLARRRTTGIAITLLSGYLVLALLITSVTSSLTGR